MRTSGGRTLGVVLTAAAVLGFAPSSALPVAAAEGRAHVSPDSPNPSSTTNVLQAVSASSANDVWAVGEYETSGEAYDTLILHWNGSVWSEVPSPDPSSTDNDLDAVRAVSSTNAWAVGDYVNDATHATETLILHWNGTVWSMHASPNPSSVFNSLEGVNVSSTSPRSGWAVGAYDNVQAGIEETLTIHWNGTKWSRVTSPNPSTKEDSLSSVRVPSQTNAWAVGYGGASIQHTLILHWNGSKWSRVTSPNPSTTHDDLRSTSGVSPTNGWAVGEYVGNSSHVPETLVLHWNGSSWSHVSSPSPSSVKYGSVLASVRAVSSTNAWAVGQYEDNTTGRTDSLVLRWNGTKWTSATVPEPGTTDVLLGVTATSATNAWAVGYYVDASSNSLTYVLHWNGTSWSQA